MPKIPNRSTQLCAQPRAHAAVSRNVRVTNDRAEQRDHHADRQHEREADDDRRAELLAEEVQHGARDQRRRCSSRGSTARRGPRPRGWRPRCVLPLRSSSFMRSKIRMLASTAMPTDRMKPAMPARVSVTGMSLKMRQREQRVDDQRARDGDARQAVVQQHEQHDDEQRDLAGDDALAHRVSAQRGVDGALLLDRDRHRQRARVELQRQQARLVKSHAGDDAGGAQDGLDDRRRDLARRPGRCPAVAGSGAR